MTRKDYVRMADAIGYSVMVSTGNLADGGLPLEARNIIEALGASLKQDNPAFDYERFLARILDVASNRVSVDRPAYESLLVA